MKVSKNIGMGVSEVKKCQFFLFRVNWKISIDHWKCGSTIFLAIGLTNRKQSLIKFYFQQHKCIQICLFCFFFLDFLITLKYKHDIFVFLFLFHSLLITIIFLACELCVYATHSLRFLWWILSLIPCFGYFDQCDYKHGFASISLIQYVHIFSCWIM